MIKNSFIKKNKWGLEVQTLVLHITTSLSTISYVHKITGTILDKLYFI